MCPSIEVDEDVYAALQERAVPFVDTPNSVLRHLLQLDVSGTQPVEAANGEPARLVVRARRGELLSERAYEMPILEYLVSQDGEAPASETITAVGQVLASQLTPTDKTLNSSGLIRWQNRTQFARLNLVKSGDLDPTSPRGIWRITQQGRLRVGANENGS